MKVLGIDPGSLRCGFSVLEDLGGRLPRVREAGVWRLGDGAPLADRLARLWKHLDQILTEHSPDVLSIEESFVHKNVHSAMVLGHARGVVLAACASRGMTVVEFAPSSIKQTVAGSGRATKERVAEMARRQLGLQELPDSADATDALAIALCWFGSRSTTTGVVSGSKAARTKKKGFDVEAYLKRIGKG
ncbi:MAG TPA: crossover junction endodeoxyribonuclease RuvC [Fibrobacteria bacterium]|nr:crossover junction endodeoxyribonuclease RuvC [Fibrobacteria bacterium]